MSNTVGNVMITEARYVGKSGNRNATSNLAVKHLDVVIKQRRKGRKCNPTLLRCAMVPSFRNYPHPLCVLIRLMINSIFIAGIQEISIDKKRTLILKEAYH
jgi:hypothetical protein